MKNPVKFGKYYLLERIAVGGMAEVFKAKSFGEAGFERLVAVKRILPSIAEDQEFIMMFVDEAKLAVQLTHPNIAQIFELGKVGEAYFIALEYVAGKDMRAIFERSRKRTETVPIPMACYMVMKLCEGLDYAHNKKDAAGRPFELVHRDVSPQNILVSYDGDVKLIDFGIAKAASKSSKTQAGILKGKFGYMSPEQVRGLGVDRRSDVFAVGICLYELLTMERLFTGESDFSTLEKVRNVEIMPPSTYNKKIPEELEAIVLKALAKHPEDRYRTAMDLHDDLQSFMYTSGNFFARKDLAGYQHRLFGEEITREAARDEEFKKFDSRKASDLEVFEGVGAPQPPMAQGRQAPPAPPPTRSLAAPPPPPPTAVPPPPPPRPPSRTVMGVGMSAVPQTPPPPPPPTRAATPTPAPTVTPRMAVAPVAASAPVAALAPMSGSAPVQAMEMDWDEEELETQVFDKPDGVGPSSVPAPAVAAAPLRSTAAPRSTPSIPVVPALPQIPAMARPSMATSLGVAPPPPPTSSLPAAPMPISMLPAVPAPGIQPSGVMSGPGIGAPAIGAPPVPRPSSPPSAMPNGTSANGGRYGSDPSGMPMTGHGHRAGPASLGKTSDWPAGASSLMPQARDNTLLRMVIAGIGVVVVATGVLLFMWNIKRNPVGSLAITTNVGGVAVIIDEQPQIGNGQSFAVNDLSSDHIHHVVVRKPGYRTFQQDVPVTENRVTPMQVVLEPEPSVTPPVPVVAQPAPVAPSEPPAVPTVPTVAQPAPVLQPEPTVAQPLAPPPTLTPVPTPAPAPVATPRVVQRAPRPAVHPPAPRPQERTAHAPVEHPGTVRNTTAHAIPVVPVPPVANPTHTGTPAGGTAAQGTLRLSTRPAAQCTLNGETFSTPAIRHLPPGTYQISCHNDELQARARWSVTINPGGDVRDLNHALDN